MPSTYCYPRPEYPRPDRQRGFLDGVDWLNLNGPWQFRFDPERRGHAERWFEPDDLVWREQIIVPFCWESLAAWREGDSAGNENYYSSRVFLNPLEVNRSNHRSAPRHEVGWYRRRLEITNGRAWRGKRVILTVGAADFFTEAWCNGRHLGNHEGGYTPFEFDLTDSLHRREDGTMTGLLVLRVEDPMDNHEQPVGKQWRWYTTTSGIWQTVFIEPRSATHVDSFRFTPMLEAQTAHVAVNCIEAEGCSVTVETVSPDGQALPVETFPVEKSMASGVVQVAPLRLWDPNSPQLYSVVLTLRRNRKVLDTVRTYFGMRKIDFAPPASERGAVQLRLNGGARYLRGALYQSYFPEGVYTAGDVERLKSDIRLAKQFGFNFLRIHIKIDDPLFLHYADTMGIMLMADFPNFGEGGDTSTGRRRFEQMMREAIKRDFNHPSIVAWCMFNETWGFGGQVDLVKLLGPPPSPGVSEAAEREPPAEAGASETASVAAAAEALQETDRPEPRRKLANLPAQAWVQRMWEVAKRLDPTRLIEDMSVCMWEHLDYYAHGDTDINSWHFYIHDYERAREHIEKVAASTYPGSTFNYVPGYRHKGQPLINSEYGGIGALDGDRDVSWSFKFLTNELRRHQKIAAYIYTELHDVEWEYNGFLNYDRTPKDFGYDPRIINESNVLVVNAPPVARHAPGSSARVPVSSSHFSVQQHSGVTLQWRLVGVDTRGRLHQELARGSRLIAFRHRRVAPARVVEVPLPAEPMLCTLQLHALDRHGTLLARNFVHYLVADRYPAEREEGPRGLVLRQKPCAWSDASWQGRMRTRERSEAEDVCFGFGTGWFEWRFVPGGLDMSRVRRLRVLVEASSHRRDTPQTDNDGYPTRLQVELNEVRIHDSLLPNHPHDSRGVLSYLRGGKGAYGYLVNASASGESLRQVIESTRDGEFRLRCVVPDEDGPAGGLTIYGAEAGRYPVCPTLIFEW